MLEDCSCLPKQELPDVSIVAQTFVPYLVDRSVNQSSSTFIRIHLVIHSNNIALLCHIITTEGAKREPRSNAISKQHQAKRFFIHNWLHCSHTYTPFIKPLLQLNTPFWVGETFHEVLGTLNQCNSYQIQYFWFSSVSCFANLMRQSRQTTRWLCSSLCSSSNILSPKARNGGNTNSKNKRARTLFAHHAKVGPFHSCFERLFILSTQRTVGYCKTVI